MSETGAPATLDRHEEFYYEDGNICLQAGNVVFRLLKSQLARHSTVFADMLVVGGEQSSTLKEEDVYEGVPLIRVEESAEGWTVVCQLLWNPPAEEQSRDLDAIASALRISTKYGMDKLHECSKRWLEQVTLYHHVKHKNHPLPTLEHYGANPDLAAKVVALAQNCDVPSVLRLAMYHVAVASSSTLRRPVGIANEDIVRIMIGRDRLLAKWWDLVRGNESIGLDQSVVGCECRVENIPGKQWRSKGTSRIRQEVNPKVNMLEEGSRDPIVYLSKQSKNKSLCAKCRDEHHKAMMDIYKNLETIFDLTR